MKKLDLEHSVSRNKGLAAALGAAFFFGVSTPFSKLFLGSISAPVLAGLLYIGSFAGLSLAAIFKRGASPVKEREAALRGRDYLYLSGSILAGGVGAPLFLLYGLDSTEASAASLLLNTEGVLTVLLAYLFFGEHVGKRVWASAAVMLAASSILSYAPSNGWPVRYGSLFVLASALMWALDNNLTRELSHRDPFTIARLKGLASGSVNLAIAFFLGESAPALGSLAGALVLGALSYGAALVLFIYALRNIGTSRTSTYFGAAPLIGAAVSIAAFGDSLSLQIISSSALMLSGLWLTFRECHEHEHTHFELCHEHAHVHDEHHDHTHEDGSTGPHSHVHSHSAITHSHAHVPDLHHFHGH